MEKKMVKLIDRRYHNSDALQHTFVRIAYTFREGDDTPRTLMVHTSSGDFEGVLITPVETGIKVEEVVRSEGSLITDDDWLLTVINEETVAWKDVGDLLETVMEAVSKRIYIGDYKVSSLGSFFHPARLMIWGWVSRLKDRGLIPAGANVGTDNVIDINGVCYALAWWTNADWAFSSENMNLILRFVKLVPEGGTDKDAMLGIFYKEISSGIGTSVMYECRNTFGPCPKYDKCAVIKILDNGHFGKTKAALYEPTTASDDYCKLTPSGVSMEFDMDSLNGGVYTAIHSLVYGLGKFDKSLAKYLWDSDFNDFVVRFVEDAMDSYQFLDEAVVEELSGGSFTDYVKAISRGKEETETSDDEDEAIRKLLAKCRMSGIRVTGTEFWSHSSDRFVDPSLLSDWDWEETFCEETEFLKQNIGLLHDLGYKIVKR